MIIDHELDKIIKYYDNNKNINVNMTKEKAFNILGLMAYCYNDLDISNNFIDINKINVTDGTADGGIDFVCFDEDLSKVVVGQSKYSGNVDKTVAVAEIKKILNTLDDFKNKKSSKYNSMVRENLQNAIDRLTEEFQDNIEIVFISNSDIDEKRIRSEYKTKPNYDLLIIGHNELEDMIIKLNSKIETVDEFKFKLDGKGNFLEYSSEEKEGVFVNIDSVSLIDAYNKFESKGLFDLNIRRYISNKNVDDAINHTLSNKRDNFWFLNNGLTIACEEYEFDGKEIKIKNFSIVNGGQTTKLIADYKGDNNDSFYIPAKIVSSRIELTDEEKLNFFNDIAEATNSQKPIQPRDLKSNSPEMIRLRKILLDKGINLEIKRGIKADKNKLKIKNDEFAQSIFSFVNQKPGTARNNKNSLFSNKKNYDSVFRVNYEKNKDKTDFIVDLIHLYNKLDETFRKIKEGNLGLDSNEINVAGNAKFTVLSIIGVLYRVANKMVSIDDLLSAEDNEFILTNNFEYKAFISNYKEDNIDSLLESLVVKIVENLANNYKNEFEKNRVTSPSNFFKTDAKYLDTILTTFIKEELRSDYRRKEYEEQFFPLLKTK